MKFWENVTQHHVYCVICHLSPVTCHVSHVTYYMSHVMCPLSHVIKNNNPTKKIGQSGGANRWRVCYQMGRTLSSLTHYLQKIPPVGGWGEGGGFLDTVWKNGASYPGFLPFLQQILIIWSSNTSNKFTQILSVTRYKLGEVSHLRWRGCLQNSWWETSAATSPTPTSELSPRCLHPWGGSSRSSPSGPRASWWGLTGGASTSTSRSSRRTSSWSFLATKKMWVSRKKTSREPGTRVLARRWTSEWPGPGRWPSPPSSTTAGGMRGGCWSWRTGPASPGAERWLSPWSTPCSGTLASGTSQVSWIVPCPLGQIN